MASSSIEEIVNQEGVYAEACVKSEVCNDNASDDSQSDEGPNSNGSGNGETIVNRNNIQSSTGIFPCINKYPGTYNFQVELPEGCNRKSWVFSSKLGKVFVDVDKILLFKFRINTKSISNLRVRAILVYANPNDNHLPVNRCMLHALQNNSDYLEHVQNNVCNCEVSKLAGHVLTSNHTEAEYEYNRDSGRHSVVVPLEEPQAGSESMLIGYQFGCKTSCESGMARRCVNLIFTLETDQDEVVGRSVMKAKVCSCPKRDKDREELMGDTSTNPDSSNDRLRGTKRKINSSQEDLSSGYINSSSSTQFMILFNQIEQMSQLMRQSVEAQKKQIEATHRSQTEIMNAIEELTNKIIGIQEDTSDEEKVDE